MEDFRSRYRHAFDTYCVQLPANLRTLAMTEAKAKKIVSYEVLVLPGLLQTQGYARALLAEDGIEAEEDIVAVKRARRMFARLDAVALEAEQSRSKLAEYVSGLREDFHGPRTDLA
ncbi:hypothetical protein SAMN05216553_106354 [Lentzea fradiae]|uniref:DUF5753 domain-containing protein n=1 Tax=Lentzea fradiae TaxID=200378 RepID=A0A1G7SMM0_9PSEU|nr:Scr1 family TA system antitoxin-like transcriptional regulator [Lentzea fradiae]SDG24347.1 hypothetical protein SAMN05216553_106354 [Lentzea fradiae]